MSEKRYTLYVTLPKTNKVTELQTIQMLCSTKRYTMTIAEAKKRFEQTAEFKVNKKNDTYDLFTVKVLIGVKVQLLRDWFKLHGMNYPDTWVVEASVQDSLEGKAWDEMLNKGKPFFVQTNAPANPAIGDVYLNENTGHMMLYDGKCWVSI